MHVCATMNTCAQVGGFDLRLDICLCSHAADHGSHVQGALQAAGMVDGHAAAAGGQLRGPLGALRIRGVCGCARPDADVPALCGGHCERGVHVPGHQVSYH